jgi:hypothetical protein
MKLQLDRFSHEALADAAQSRGESPEDVLRAAVAHYLGQRDSGRNAWPVPRFLRAEAEQPGLDVPLEGALGAALESEAERQHVTLDRLAEHALLLWLADADRGGPGGACAT